MKQEELKKLLARGNDDLTVQCAKCGGRFVGIGPVTIDQGGHTVAVNGRRADQTDHSFVQYGRAENRLRGSCVVISFACESGHTFTRTIAFHKGGTFLIEEIGADFDPSAGEFPPTLWRN
jgi:hypothetical protein